MRKYVLLIILLLSPAAFGQDQPKVIGEIEFFGYSGIDLNRVKASLPFHERDPFSIQAFAEKEVQAGGAVKQAIGRAPTDIAPVCCDDEGNWIIFIGLSGKTIRYNHPPGSPARLPENILNLYERFTNLLMEGLQKGSFAEDSSQGYALAEYAPLRSVQLEMRAYAVGHEALLRDVLENSSEDQQRIVAAMLLGYAPQSRSQISALVQASRDSNSTVRNNATRALIVLAKSGSKVAEEIPATDFIELLLSGTWTDLNKASSLLDPLTKSRNAKVLAQLQKREVRERLIEMARWRVGHAEPARYILGRIAGIDESRLKQLVASKQVDEIIDAVRVK
jgi:hypothetical protein